MKVIVDYTTGPEVITDEFESERVIWVTADGYMHISTEKDQCVASYNSRNVIKVCRTDTRPTLTPH